MYTLFAYTFAYAIKQTPYAFVAKIILCMYSMPKCNQTFVNHDALQTAVQPPLAQPRSQGLRGKTVTKTLVKFVLSFQNFGKKIACAVRHNRIAIAVEYGCVSLRMRFFSQNFGTIKPLICIILDHAFKIKF